MFCEAYNQSLTDAAANGEGLSPVLQQHLTSCERCRAAFAEEQSLFAAIDSGLRAAANSEVPSTLIPRVHVTLNNEPVPRTPNFALPIWGFAGTVVTAAVVFGLLYLPSKHRPMPAEPTRPSPVATITSSLHKPALNPATAAGVSRVQHKMPVVLVASGRSKPVSPEVLVSPDEGAALLRYEEFLRRKQSSVLMASAKSVDLRPGIEPLQIVEIELVDLRIPALSKWEPEDDTK